MDEVARQQKTKTKYSKGAATGFFMVMPTVIGLIILNIYPLLRTVYMSFFKSGAFGKWTFVGLDNYIKMFQSAGFWTITKNTLVFMVLTVPVTVILPYHRGSAGPEDQGKNSIQSHLLSPHGSCSGGGSHGVEVVV